MDTEKQTHTQIELHVAEQVNAGKSVLWVSDTYEEVDKTMRNHVKQLMEDDKQAIALIDPTMTDIVDTLIGLKKDGAELKNVQMLVGLSEEGNRQVVGSYLRLLPYTATVVYQVGNQYVDCKNKESHYQIIEVEEK
ncbi:hypothetical protein [Bacillus thuringiensis]|uniref:hypothetical protein n=1 Tax=Bacillus thuringiensis TaxID=1428 RepID=UPI000BFE3E66|nr:hypothetical protein [Bacillus thuringiensis]PGT90106.1 hypothetical protein COD17_10170 [Bacillus thuringiensis]